MSTVDSSQLDRKLIEKADLSLICTSTTAGLHLFDPYLRLPATLPLMKAISRYAFYFLLDNDLNFEPSVAVRQSNHSAQYVSRTVT